MKEHLVTETRDEYFLYWQISRPARFNAIGPNVAAELRQLTKAAKKLLGKPKNKKHPHPIAIFLSAATAKGRDNLHWIAGGDLQELAKIKNSTQAKNYAKAMQSVCDFFCDAPLPIVVVMDGLATGGGAELALAGDLRIGNHDAGFHFKQLDVGLTTGYGGTSRLVELCGTAIAERLIYSRERIDATEAHQLGLLTHKFENISGGVEEIKRWLIGANAKTIAAQKKLLRVAGQQSTKATNQLELRQFQKLWGNPTHRFLLQKFTKTSLSDK